MKPRTNSRNKGRDRNKLRRDDQRSLRNAITDLTEPQKGASMCRRLPCETVSIISPEYCRSESAVEDEEQAMIDYVGGKRKATACEHLAPIGSQTTQKVTQKTLLFIGQRGREIDVQKDCLAANTAE